MNFVSNGAVFNADQQHILAGNAQGIMNNGVNMDFQQKLEPFMPEHSQQLHSALVSAPAHAELHQQQRLQQQQLHQQQHQQQPQDNHAHHQVQAQAQVHQIQPPVLGQPQASSVESPRSGAQAPPAAPGGAPSNGQQPHSQTARASVGNGSGAASSSASLASFPPGLPFHNPFDTHSYPLTNPPIFDYTMKFPYTANDGGQRRRRISISNGQIGQIINHEAFFEYENVSDENSNEFPPYNALHSQHQHQLPSAQSQPVQLQQAQVPQQSLEVADTSFDKGHLGDGEGAAGVPPPNHQLIYDNEVIYNPNDGPIPGTAAWKKERLLERNRIAASRCRQRKKQAQQTLQNNVSKYQLEVKALEDKVDKYREVIKRYNSAIAKHASECKNFESLTLMRMLEEIDLDEEEQKILNI